MPIAFSGNLTMIQSPFNALPCYYRPGVDSFWRWQIFSVGFPGSCMHTVFVLAVAMITYNAANIAIIIIMSPLWRGGGHVGLPLSLSLCLWVLSAMWRRSNMRRWHNARIMLAHRLQRHKRRANINPALVQSIVPVPPACRYRQHEVLTRTEWILASTGDAGPTFKIYWIGVSL